MELKNCKTIKTVILHYFNYHRCIPSMERFLLFCKSPVLCLGVCSGRFAFKSALIRFSKCGELHTGVAELCRRRCAKQYGSHRGKRNPSESELWSVFSTGATVVIAKEVRTSGERHHFHGGRGRRHLLQRRSINPASLTRVSRDRRVGLPEGETIVVFSSTQL